MLKTTMLVLVTGSTKIFTRTRVSLLTTYFYEPTLRSIHLNGVLRIGQMDNSTFALQQNDKPFVVI
jgi:hypothetical protein